MHALALSYLVNPASLFSSGKVIDTTIFPSEPKVDLSFNFKGIYFFPFDISACIFSNGAAQVASKHLLPLQI